ncbi:MAG: TIGR00269 family protein, partial [Candidatus Micrarchaeota archaeon]|nr:TIGR00269 family protein [Candidatus Micrarchaeota archaeon]
KSSRSFGACTYCGVFRRTLLNRAARRLKVDKLAMGHNLDDAAQTVLMNLMRNEPARLARFGPGAIMREGRAKGRGLSPQGGQSSLVPRIQPLIRCPEKEVALYAVLHGIGIHFMSCPNASEAMRQTVRQQLNEMEDKYPGTKARIFNAFLTMQPALLEGMGTDAGAKEIGVCKSCGDASSGDRCAACKLLQSLRLGKKGTAAG